MPAAAKLEEEASVSTTEEANAKMLAAMFPSLPASAIADALGKAGGDMQHAVDGLLKAAQVRVLCKPYTSTHAPTPTPSIPPPTHTPFRHNDLPALVSPPPVSRL